MDTVHWQVRGGGIGYQIVHRTKIWFSLLEQVLETKADFLLYFLLWKVNHETSNIKGCGLGHTESISVPYRH